MSFDLILLLVFLKRIRGEIEIFQMYLEIEFMPLEITTYSPLFQKDVLLFSLGKCRLKANFTT